MDEISVDQESKAARPPASDSFRRFLAFLDNGIESNGMSYIEMHRRLAGYFARKGCDAPEDLADETLNRVSRRLDEEGSIDSDIPARYCYITARFVFLEQVRAGRMHDMSIDETTLATNGHGPLNVSGTDEREKKEVMLECLDECMLKLDEGNRELILGYYYGNERVKIENRRSMAERLNISLNALSIRACRLRRALESCVGKCADGKMK